jgi:hypothetical protein
MLLVVVARPASRGRTSTLATNASEMFQRSTATLVSATWYTSERELLILFNRTLLHHCNDGEES